MPLEECGSSHGKRDVGLIPGWGRSPGGEHSNPLQDSCLENPNRQRSLAGCSPWGCKDLDMTEHAHTGYKSQIYRDRTRSVGSRDCRRAWGVSVSWGQSPTWECRKIIQLDVGVCLLIFLWPLWVLIEALRIFACRMCGLVSLTRNGTQVPCIGRSES